MCNFNHLRIFSRGFSQSLVSYLEEIRLGGSVSVQRTDGRTDGYDECNMRISRPKATAPSNKPSDLILRCAKAERSPLPPTSIPHTKIQCCCTYFGTVQGCSEFCTYTQCRGVLYIKPASLLRHVMCSHFWYATMSLGHGCWRGQEVAGTLTRVLICTALV